MGVPSRVTQYTIEEYLSLERYSNTRHEFLDGQIFAMGGGTPQHGAMAVRLATQLSNQLRGRPCNVYNSDVRVRVVATGLHTYPDLSVVCGPEEHDRHDQHAIINPVVIIEITSPSSAAYDRGAKLDHYKQIPSLREVLIVSHETPAVEIWRRESGDHWRCEWAGGADTVTLSAIDCQIDVADVYRNPVTSG